MGTTETGAANPPNIIPELQNKSVISVVLGDYHYGALTSSGSLYTWGQYSQGALGLGDPTKLDAGSPGGFRTEQQRLLAVDRHFGSPPDVTVPTEVNFNHNMKNSSRRFCFAVAAAGWHMGALVVDLDEVEDEEEVEDVEEVPAEHAREPPRNRGRGGGGIFRVGLAGRGVGRGGPPHNA
jgi:SCF-associated factor 1